MTNSYSSDVMVWKKRLPRMCSCGFGNPIVRRSVWWSTSFLSCDNNFAWQQHILRPEGDFRVPSRATSMNARCRSKNV
jgi:hypothetical protein